MSEEVEIQLPLGRVRGRATGRGEARVFAFKGLRYAEPPIGARRWRPPAPAQPWAGVRVADTFGPDCLQPGGQAGSFYFQPQRIQSEDCLYLNVWTPVDPNDAPRALPVMVWIHGGGFQSGSGAFEISDGARLARKGVVVVTLNYRLGLFGYFTHPEIVEEAGGGPAANFGVLDQIEALRWVKQCIAAFGGDPGNVTIFGESAGAIAVRQLLASPLSRGLFHKAIAQSAPYFAPMPLLRRDSGSGSAEELGLEFSWRLGATRLAELRDIPGRDLMEFGLQHASVWGGGALFALDGVVFDAQVDAVFEASAQHPVPVLVGYNAQEASGLAELGVVPIVGDPGVFASEVRRRYGSLADELLALYPAATPQQSAMRWFTDDAFGWGAVEWAERTCRIGQDAYLYVFSHAPPGARGERHLGPGGPAYRVGAFHGAEIPYCFNNFQGLADPRWTSEAPAPSGEDGRHLAPEDLALADRLSDFWTSFATSGRPVAASGPAWEPWRQERRVRMDFGGTGPTAEEIERMWRLTSKVYARRSASNAMPAFFQHGFAGAA